MDVGRVEGVGDAGPNQQPVGRRCQIDIRLDAHLLLLLQVSRRIDHRIERPVVTIEGVVVGIRQEGRRAGNVGDGIVHFHQARDHDCLDLVGLDLLSEVGEIELGAGRAKQNGISGYGFQAFAREFRRQRVFKICADLHLVAEPHGQDPVNLLRGRVRWVPPARDEFAGPPEQQAGCRQDDGHEQHSAIQARTRSVCRKRNHRQKRLPQFLVFAVDRAGLRDLALFLFVAGVQSHLFRTTRLVFLELGK